MRNSSCIIFCEVFSTVPFMELNLRKRGWSWELDNHSVMKAAWNLFLCFLFSMLMGFSLLYCDTWTPTPEYFKIVLSMRGEMLSIIFTDFLKEVLCANYLGDFGLEGPIAFRDTGHSNSETYLSHFAHDFSLSFSEHLYSCNIFQVWLF